ncbi:uncharacterized protein LOC111243901 [Varroa destructor]|uniref:Uncharacterized protein n=1 Tax=Varroa destructor TaxID=109461 RepID=A0A7M7JGB3_VARDE|nr:uncharacterized protein LOC111243901 [Varroa destructor]
MADVKEGRKRVAVVDNLIKRLRAKGELNIQPVRHFGPKYGQRHNPYANGVKKYELTGAGIYREDIACANTPGSNSTATSPHNHNSNCSSTTNGSINSTTEGHRPQLNQTSSTASSCKNQMNAKSSRSLQIGGRSGGQMRRFRKSVFASSSYATNDLFSSANVPAIDGHMPHIRRVGDDRLGSRDRADGERDMCVDIQHASGIINVMGSSNGSSPTSDHYGPGDDMVSIVQGDEAGQSDMYLCRLDNGFAQETTL